MSSQYATYGYFDIQARIQARLLPSSSRASSLCHPRRVLVLYPRWPLPCAVQWPGTVARLLWPGSIYSQLLDKIDRDELHEAHPAPHLLSKLMYLISSLGSVFHTTD